jgi:hypothetical protein
MRMKKGLAMVMAVSGMACFSAGARANLLIVPTFDSSITADPNAGAIEAGINAAIGRIDGDIANPVTVAITFKEGSGSLAGNQSAFSNLGYSPYLFRLNNNQTVSPADAMAIGSLPAGPNNPVDGNASVTGTMALFRALGIAVFPAGGAPDDIITLNTSQMNLSRVGPQNPNFFDIQALAGHEIDESLGIGGNGSALGLTTTGPVGVLDLYRYSGSGARSFSTLTGAKAYFSIDGGATDLVNFNQAGGGSDYGDWGDGVTPADSLANLPPVFQDAFATRNADEDVGPVELKTLDIIGWDLTAAGAAIENAPEPGSCAMLAAGGLMLLRRRRR